MNANTLTGTNTGVEIAIVGMAGRFPNARDIEAFWRNLHDGVESVVALGDEDLRARGVSDAALGDRAYVKRGVLLEGMAEFDAEFFGFSPRAAERLDPQQRVFLQVAWAALEHAGYAGESRPEVIGTYAGSGANFYLLRHLLPSLAAGASADVSSLLGLLAGNDKDSLATRVAYKLNLRGPALSLQTACSTSLVAVHQACQSLLCHETDMALAGGVWLNLLQGEGYLHESGGILSVDGHCRAFDARASGTSIGSGAGVVVLRRLRDALNDGDTIHAIIKGSAINNDGSAKVGFTAPSVEGQAAVIALAQAIAGVEADTIGYVEAHGTGTTLGDPIEIAALTQAFRASTARRGFCALGSLKTNVGHLDAAAGVAGLIKVTLSLEHQSLPASLNFEHPNPAIDFVSSPFFVNAEPRPWPRGTTPRRAAVSSFGIGGTNAHVIVEEAPVEVRAATGSQATMHALLLSARSAHALEVSLEALAVHLDEHPEQELSDVAHTLRVGRARFEHRALVWCRGRDSAIANLRTRAVPSYFSGRVLSQKPSVAFLFPGQGAQHVGMGQALYAEQRVFREVVDHCSELLAPALGLDLRTAIFATDSTAAARLSQTALTQPALFVIEYAFARLWTSYGVLPDAMLGHSVGEYVAACLSGVFELEDALRVIAVRGRLLQSTDPGAMLALNLGEAEVQPYLRTGCDLAAVNGVDRCVLAGTEASIAEIERIATAAGVALRRLRVSHAYHSSLVEPALADFEAALQGIELKAPRIPFVSNVTGQFISVTEAQSPAYWVKHARSTVRFADGLTTLLAKRDRILLEVGPGAVLSGLARRHAHVGERPVLASQPAANQLQDDAELALRSSLAQLWLSGIEVEGDAFGASSSPRRVPLPTYPFARDCHWIERSQETHGGTALVVEPSTESAEWLYVPSWKRASALPIASGSSLGTTLILSDARDLCERLAVKLRAGGERVVLGHPAPAFQRSSSERYGIRPEERSDVERLVRSVESEHGPIARVCHLLCLDPELGPHPGDPLDRGFFSLLALAQAFDAVAAERSLSIIVIANGLEDIAGTEPLFPDKATLQGAAKVIPLEYPHLACRVVDVIAPSADEGSIARLLEQMASEVHAPPSEPWAAYRGVHRWQTRFEPVRARATLASRLRDAGSYLITGGLGGVGLSIARYLAETRRARLVLVGRTKLPQRETWQALAADEQTAPVVRQTLRSLLELCELGGEVLVVQADVCQPGELQLALEAARARFGVIHGVIHAAGVPGGGVIMNKTRAEVTRVLAPKVSGTRALVAALGREPLDFLLFCSSLSAVTGDFGQVDYCAANCFLDALACDLQRTFSGLVLSVNWDVWRDVGMAAAQKLPEGLGITPSQGGQVLERLLSNDFGSAQIALSTVDLQRRFSPLSMSELAERLSFARVPVRQQQARPALATAYVEPHTQLERDLASVWSEFIGVSPVGVDDSLFELGGDSLLAVQVLTRVHRQYGVDPPIRAFLNTPTVATLAALIELQLIEQIEASGTPLAASE